MDTVLNQAQKMALKQIVNAIKEGIVLYNSDYEIIYYNDRYIKIFNIPEKLIQNDDYAGIKNYIKSILLNPEQYFIDAANVFSYKYEICETPKEFALKDGRCFTRLVTHLEVFGLRWILFSFREITKDKEFENLLKESKKKYQRLLNNIPDLVLLHDNYRCVYANSIAADCLGYNNPVELRGIDLREFLTANVFDILRNEYNGIVQEIGLGNSIELQVLSKNNDFRWLKLISYTKFQKDSNLWMIIFRDITEKKITIELQQLVKEREERLEVKRNQNQLKYDFFTNLSHELKTPINIIAAASYMLGADIKECSQKEKKYIDIIDTNCKRLVRGINNFIDLEKIESGYFKVDMEICNIIRTIEDISLSAIPYAKIKEIELVFDTDVEEKYIKIDINFIERIILNLLSNAIKFTKPKGKVQVLLSDLGEEIKISIKDTGIGISKENSSYIFARFGQGDQLTEYNSRGNGIGLYLVKRLVKIMGGRICVNSEVGKGSVFTVILPAVYAEVDNAKVEETLSRRKFENTETTKIELSDINNI